MTDTAPDELRIVALNGMLGYGYRLASLEEGIAQNPHMIGVDAGSTDAGPYYLGSGTSLTRPGQVYRDLRHAVVAARRAGIPMMVGSAGFGGGIPHVARIVDMVRQIAREDSLSLRCAVIQSEIDRQVVLDALRDGRIEPMTGVPELTEEDITESERIVAQMGTGPLIAALRQGVDLVIAGRSCDAAIFASMPLMHGFDPGLAFHMAKIMECGAQCAIPLTPGDSLLGVIRRDSFTVRPLGGERICTPASVAAHSLYEQPNPYLIVEPEGTVDVEHAEFEQIDSMSVRVTGSAFHPHDRPHKVKLEGARHRGFRTMTIAGVRDPAVIRNLDRIAETAKTNAMARLPDSVSAEDYEIRYAFYGRDAVLGGIEPMRQEPTHEVGVVIEVLATTQALANDVLALVRASTLHCPFDGRKTTAGNLAFPFSPSDFEGGPVYEFSVYHLMAADDIDALFPISIVNIAG
ncbi:MAG: acyclic terpene utilization AtuA family protein [Hyphomicrobiaceae bacterium]|nr:acyclic terpene utilization AtuA family protein [Hyphomicrobiaceae bacterium]